MSEVEEVIRHATMANFDNEVSSIVILMVAKGEPEVHMAINPADILELSASADMFKMEVLKLLNARIENKKARE